MIKNEWSADNFQIGAVRQDLRHNRELGSLFQFFKLLMLDEACEYFGVEYGDAPINANIDYDILHKLCIRLLERIA